MMQQALSPAHHGVTCFAPAKINLALHVIGQGHDGYHFLDSLVVFADVGDRISIEHSLDASNETIRCFFTGRFGKQLDRTLAGSLDHLILNAVRHFQQLSGSLDNAVTIKLEKALPIASGIGGGSADAAATLLALSKLQREASLNELMAMGSTLGADVPMCLHSQALLARGIGTEITLVGEMPKLHLLLVNPGIEISTPKIFKALVNKNNAPLPPIPSPLSASDLIDWLGQQRNDLEPPATLIASQITEALSTLRQTGAKLARMSGSGATCFGIFENKNTCETAADIIKKARPDWWVMPTQTNDYGFDRAKTL